MRNKKGLLAATIAFFVGGGAQGYAQVTSETRSAGLELEEVVVTARKREENLQDVPVAVTAMSGEQLESQGLFSLQDFGQGAIPALRVAPYPSNPSTLIVSVRGIGQTDPGQVTREAGVGVYVDGVYLGRAQGLGAELADIERVEVLRGPQGSLFGRNAVGGAVSFTTKDPQDVLALEQTLGTGSDGYVKALTRLSLPEVAGVSAKVDYMKNKRDGWVENTAPGEDDFSAYDKSGYRISLLWRASDTVSVKYAYDNSQVEATQNYFQFQTDDFFFNGGNAETQRLEKTRYAIPLDPNITDQSGHTLVANWDASDDFTIKSISSYRDLEDDQTSNFGGALGLGLMVNAQSEQSQFSQELQFIGSAFEQRVEYVGGIYYYKEDVKEMAENFGSLIPDPASVLEGMGIPHLGSSNMVSVEDFYNSAAFASLGEAGRTVIPSPVINIFGNWFGGSMPDLGLTDLRQVKADTESKALFGQLNWTPDVLDDRLHFTVGLRYTEDAKTGARPILEGQATSQSYKLKTDSVDPMFAATYDFSDNANVYFRYGTAYKAAGVNLRSLFFVTFDPEKLESYELGLKGTLFDRRVQLSTAAFWSTYRDRQIGFSVPDKLTWAETVNAPS